MNKVLTECYIAPTSHKIFENRIFEFLKIEKLKSKIEKLKIVNFVPI